MNDKYDHNAGEFRPRERNEHRPKEHHQASGLGRPYANGHAPPSNFDIWAIADLIIHRWHWLVIGVILGLGGFFILSWTYIQPKYSAAIRFLRFETPGLNEFIRTAPISPETFSALLISPELLTRVGTNMTPALPPEKLVKHMKVDPQPDSDVVLVYFIARYPQQAVDMANLYADSAVNYTKDLQARKASQVARVYLKEQVDAMTKDLNSLEEQFRALPVASLATGKVAQIKSDLTSMTNLAASPAMNPAMLAAISEKIQLKTLELQELLGKFTDEHPEVMQARASLEVLNTQAERARTNGFGGNLPATGFSLGGGPVVNPDLEIIQGKLRSVQDAQAFLDRRQKEAESYAKNPPGDIEILARANLQTVETNKRRMKIGVATAFGGVVGLGCALLLLLLTEAMDNRLKTVDDVKRVTRLPVLTTLGDLNEMKNGDREQWAFRTWTLLQGRLSRSQNHGLVCGITSSTPGEGRSTWINLLSEAASLSGFRVLTIATQPSATHVGDVGQLTEETFNQDGQMKTTEQPAGEEQVEQSAALTPNVLASPAQVTDQLTGPNSRPVVHIPLPGWVWNLERRKQWRSALSHWRQIDNLVIFVELPPACVPESVLLGANLPNLIWLAESGTAQASETRTQIETLRHARCNLVGAVLNREPNKPIRRRFARWLSCFALAAGISVAEAQVPPSATNNPEGGAPRPAASPPSQATSPAPQPAAPAAAPAPGQAAQPAPVFREPLDEPLEPRTNLSFSAVARSGPRAPWQQRLTLGPGDVLTFSLYGEPMLTRTEVAIGPDGRVSFQEATDVLAAGLTVDELRQKIDEQLSRFRRAPRTMITPVQFKSKKYYVLGKVVQRGVYTLDRPITVIEAIARAQGLENGLVESDTVDLADLSRSFIARNGKRLPVNFEKLFHSGDLSQNVAIEPGDYLFFPSANVRQVYVLGEVGLPGPVTMRPDTTVLTALAARGGFNEKAYKSRVLVIRGSLNNPQTFAVNTLDVTKGRATDFRLQAKDIIYVSHRPFFKAEDLLDLATTAFVQSAIATWVGDQVLEP